MQNRCTERVVCGACLEAGDCAHVKARGSLGDQGHLLPAQVMEGGRIAYCCVVVGDLKGAQQCKRNKQNEQQRLQ